MALWVLQALLALVFLAAGLLKTTQPIPTLSKRLVWAAEYPSWFVRFIGIAEILGAVGLILPAATNILPNLSIAAAGGLILVMVLAALFHAQRKEYSHIGSNVGLLLAAVLIVVGRVTIAHF